MDKNFDRWNRLKKAINAADESERLVKYVDGGGSTSDPKAALADVFWVLLNSPEFLLNH